MFTASVPLTPGARLVRRRSAPGEPRETTLATPPSEEPAPSATELVPVEVAPLPSATDPAPLATAPKPPAVELAPLARGAAAPAALLERKGPATPLVRLATLRLVALS